MARHGLLPLLVLLAACRPQGTVASDDPAPALAGTDPGDAWAVVVLPHPPLPGGFEPPRRKGNFRGARRADMGSIYAAPEATSVSYRLVELDEQPSSRGRVEIASDFSAMPLTLSVSDGGPWTHLSRDGVVYRSDTRAGELRVLEQAPPTASLAAIGSTLFGLGADGVVWSLAEEGGRPESIREGVSLLASEGDELLVVDTEGRLWTSPRGTGPFERVDAGGCVRELRHASRGVVLSVGGRAMRRTQGKMAPVDREDPVGVDRRFREHFRARLQWTSVTRLSDRTLVGFEERSVVDLLADEALFEVPESCGLEVLGGELFRICDPPRDDDTDEWLVSRWTATGWQSSSEEALDGQRERAEAEARPPGLLPAGARHGAMATELRGMAIGEDASQIWVTRDGAESWTPLEIPIVGDPAAVPLPEQVECTNAACRAGPFLWADTMGLARPLPGSVRIVAPSRAPDPMPALEPPGCASSPGPASSAELPPGAIECTGARSCTVDASWLGQLTPAQLNEQVRLVPWEKSGQLRGYKLYGIRPGSAPKALGFKNGDMVVQVGDIILDSEQAAVRAWAAVLRGGSFVVKAERKGTTYAFKVVVR